MKQNVCSPFEQAARVLIGLALLSLLLLLDSPLRHIGWLGLIPMATVMFGYCPISDLLRLNTCPLREKHS
jgi:hypothetical protein